VEWDTRAYGLAKTFWATCVLGQKRYLILPLRNPVFWAFQRGTSSSRFKRAMQCSEERRHVGRVVTNAKIAGGIDDSHPISCVKEPFEQFGH